MAASMMLSMKTLDGLNDVITGKCADGWELVSVLHDEEKGQWVAFVRAECSRTSEDVCSKLTDVCIGLEAVREEVSGLR